MIWWVIECDRIDLIHTAGVVGGKYVTGMDTVACVGFGSSNGIDGFSYT